MVEQNEITQNEETQIDVKAELEKLRSEFGEKFNNQQRVLTKKDQELSKLKEQLNKKEEDTTLSKTLLAILAEQRNQPVSEFEETVKEKQPDLLRQYDQITQKAEEKRKREEYAQKADAVWTRVQNLNLGEDNEDVQEVYDFLADGKLQRAELRLKKLESSKKPEVNMDKLVQEKVEEEKRKWMESTNQLVSDTGKPSSSSGQVYSKSQVDAMEAQDFIKTFGGYEGFVKAIQEGKVK